MPTECPVCQGAGINAHGHDCIPCAATGWVVRACSCGNCEDGTVRGLSSSEGWGGLWVDEQTALCVAATERPATEAEAQRATYLAVRIARAKSSEELAAIFAEFDGFTNATAA